MYYIHIYIYCMCIYIYIYCVHVYIYIYIYIYIHVYCALEKGFWEQGCSRDPRNVLARRRRGVVKCSEV